MNPLTPSDLLSHADYEAQRATFRQEIIALKKRRRIEVGPLVTLIFENRRTLLFQVQEMIRAERIFEPSKIQDELDVYNTLLPGPGELSATVMIEITTQERIKDILDSFQQFDRPDTLALTVGGSSRVRRVRSRAQQGRQNQRGPFCAVCGSPGFCGRA